MMKMVIYIVSITCFENPPHFYFQSLEGAKQYGEEFEGDHCKEEWIQDGPIVTITADDDLSPETLEALGEMCKAAYQAIIEGKLGKSKRPQEENQMQCDHLESFEVDGGLYCPMCDSIVAVSCPLCGGQGFGEECELEGDWVNYGNDLVTCPECNGERWTSGPSFQ